MKFDWKILVIVLSCVVILGLCFYQFKDQLIPSQTELSGEIFIVTGGRENVKLALVEVTARNEKDEKGENIIRAKTDSNGKFSMKLPYGRYWIDAYTTRRIITETEHYVWNVPFEASQPNQTISLNNENLR